MTLRIDRLQGRHVGVVALECIGAVAVASGLVASFDPVSPVTGLSVIYLLAVLFVAIRHGERAALGTAVLSVLTLNFFFIEPRYQFEVQDPDNLVALAVLLTVAVVVGRLATAAQARAAEAERRAREATAREREAAMLAAAATSLLEHVDARTQLHRIEESSGDPASSSRVRIGLDAAPSPEEGEVAVRLVTTVRPGWLYLREGAWSTADQERIAGALGRLVDVAFEREQLVAKSSETEATRRADVMKTAILHAISHDLRSPLTAITTAASALGESDLAPADHAELVSVVQDESARLARLVDDLLDLSRIEADAVNPSTDWCDLPDVITAAVAHVSARQGDFSLEFGLPDSLPLVLADPAQLERVFTNLLENAAKFSPPGSAVRVTGAVMGQRVTIRIIDEGRGIPRSERMRIFEPFARGSDSRRGAGLGLAICRGFVEANGGSIALQSGGGQTSFAVSFPLAPQPAPLA